MIEHNYNIPDNIDDLFEEGESTYSIIDYDAPSMDNNQSMDYFIEHLDISPENILEDEGTMIIVCHKDYGYNLRIDAGGLGDFYSHKFEVSKNES